MDILIYWAQDRADMEFTVRELTQEVQQPAEAGRSRLKGAIRYALGAKGH